MCSCSRVTGGAPILTDMLGRFRGLRVPVGSQWRSQTLIRIDIVNSMFPKRVRNWIDVFGHVVFLLPFTIVMIVTGWPFFLASFRLNEQSFNAGGLPQWPAKSLVLIGFTLLLFQGISELIKRIGVMRGLIPEFLTHGGHHAAAEAEAERLLASTETRP